MTRFAKLTIPLFLASIFVWMGCVETAECDDTVGCTDGRVCYDLQCRERCDETTQCPTSQECVPCQEDQGAGVIDHCFEEVAQVCVVIP